MPVAEPPERREKLVVVEQTVVEQAVIVHVEEGRKRVARAEELRKRRPRIAVEFVCEVL